ncbi:Zinc finger C2H2, partial [Penicillium soppii]|uniref:Zinc finger C2H2 n=1 Tax=Penicillium soppii TaxID=69789 RepID=UPI00254901E3
SFAKMWECATCYDEFYDRSDCDEHMDDYDHWRECETCPRKFRSNQACNQHMDNLQHWAPEFECETCTRTFSSQNAANQHMQATGHYENYCRDCDRHFQNENCYRMHMNSKLHRGKGVNCPFCSAGFVTASGASHHLESGACPEAGRWNRDTIHRAIRSLDTNGIITKRQIEWHGDEDVQYEATHAAFDGDFWRCYICQKGFNMVHSLNAHINSPVHKSRIYHCLNKRGQCNKEFVSLAALFSHLESESCGYTRFENVQNVHRRLHDAVQGRRMITGI